MLVIFRLLLLLFFAVSCLSVVVNCSGDSGSGSRDTHISVKAIDPSTNGNLIVYLERGVIHVKVRSNVSPTALADGGNGFSVTPIKDNYLIYNGTNTEALNFFNRNSYFGVGSFTVGCIPIYALKTSPSGNVETDNVDINIIGGDSITPGYQLNESTEENLLESKNLIESIECRFLKDTGSGVAVDSSITFISLDNTEMVKSVIQNLSNPETVETFMKNNLSSYSKIVYPIIVF